MTKFVENVLPGDEIHRKPNDYLYAQRTLKHKVKIYYEEMQNLFIKKNETGFCLDDGKYARNEYEEIDGKNCNNATNLSQLYSEDTYDKDIIHDKHLFLDGGATFEKKPMLLSRNYVGETIEVVGWVSRSVCDSNGFFESPARLVYTFSKDQSIVSWLIRSVQDEVPVDFSLCIYDKENKMIFKKIVKDNNSNTYPIEVNRGMCQKIELRITRWGFKDSTRTGEIAYGKAGAKIVYFYHDAAFPYGATDYGSDELLQSFNINEYLCSSIGKANYGVQSNTAQFSLININKLFDTLKFAGYLKNGLKVQYFVSADKDYIPRLDSNGDVDEPRNQKEGVTRAIGVPQEWILLATHYITDIEFDEVKSVVKFKTQDRLIKFKDVTYSGYKKVVSNALSQIQNKDLIEDIMNRAELKTINSIGSDKSEDGIPLELSIENNKLYEITERAVQAMSKRKVRQGYLDEMSIWAALQKTCDMDLIHTYINRDDLLVIDKIDQL